ncbi:MAG: hypothetical protein AVDCRST_MAG30-3281, partial [uncultured Solirubrobacteraceae bacterium]
GAGVCSARADLRPHLRAPADRRGLRARDPLAGRLERLRARHDGPAAARRRRGGARRGRHLRGRGPRPPDGARPGPAGRRSLDARRLRAPRGRPGSLPGPGARPARLPPLPALGVRERGTRPRPAPGRARAARGAGPRAAARLLRRLLAARRAAELRPRRAPARGLPGPPLQARRHAGLGRRPDRPPRGDGGGGLRGLQGGLQGHVGRRPDGPRALPPRGRGLPGRLARGPRPRRPGGVRRPRAPSRPHHLGRADPLRGRHPQPPRGAEDGQPQAVAVRLARGAARRLRLLRGTRDRGVRRRPVRARRGPRADPVPRVAVPPRRAERHRPGRLRRARSGARAAPEPARAPPVAGRLPLGLARVL